MNIGQAPRIASPQPQPVSATETPANPRTNNTPLFQSDAVDSAKGRAEIPAACQPGASSHALRAGRIPTNFAMPPVGGELMAVGGVREHHAAGGSAYAAAAVRFTAMPGGRIVAEDLRGSGGGDVVMTPDGQGGYVGKTRDGIWHLSPDDGTGGRELTFAPARDDGDIVFYNLRVPRPERDLAQLQGRTLTLTREPVDAPVGCSATPSPVAESMVISVTVKGDDLELRLPGGESRTLRRGESATWGRGPSAPSGTYVLFSSRENTYNFHVDGFQASVPAHNPAQRLSGDPQPAQAFYAFTPHNLREITERAVLKQVPGNQLMLRFSSSPFNRPSVFYFDAETGEGRAQDGWTAKLHHTANNAERRMTLRSPYGLEYQVSLKAYDGPAYVKRFENRSAQLSIPAPDGFDRFGHPSTYMTQKTFNVRFGEAQPGSDRIALTIEGLGMEGETYTMMPLENGAYYVYTGGTKLLFTERSDGTFEARVAWYTQRFQSGTLALVEEREPTTCAD